MTRNGATVVHPLELGRARAAFEACSMAPGSRAALLDRECGDDTDLRNLVERMLAAEEEGYPILDQPLCLAAAGNSEDAWTLEPGARVGEWRVISELAAGGMGAVYLAGRADESTADLFALKIVRWPSREFARRFEREQAILRGLDHPNIARFVDGGLTENKSPYFVMEYVDGQPIDKYAAAKQLPPIELISLYRSVCEAVAHLHRNLVVHRDLKPGNILVTDSGTVKLVDFGIAKLLEAPEDSGRATNTITGLMTPDYASPEQIRSQTTSTLTDVHALGVVLYELLSGCKPFAGPGVELHETLRRICEDQPEKPSVAALRVSHSRASRSLARVLRGELDNIVLKAMRAAPEQRYRTVGEFDDDLRRYLAGLPVTAQADSFFYRSRKFVARYKAGVASAAAIVFLLIGGVVATSMEAGIARKAKAQAEIQAANAEAARTVALTEERGEEEQRIRAENEAAIAQKERANAERRLNQLETLARGAVALYRSPETQGLPPETTALIAGQARDSLKSLGAEGILTPELAPLYAEMQIDGDKSWHVPLGWSAGESNLYQYRVGIDRNFVHGGRQSLFIRALARSPEGTADVSQTFAAAPYRGKRVRVSAFIASAGANAARLWIRAARLRDTLPYTDAAKSISGATGWKNFDLVIDVPAEAEVIQFGLGLAGAGTVWVDDFRFEPVSASVPLTVPPQPDQPTNLDFRSK